MKGNAQTPQKTKDRTKWHGLVQLFFALIALVTATANAMGGWSRLTVVGLTAIAVAPVVWTAVTLEIIAERLKTIAEALPDTRNLPVTLRLDEEQWKNVSDAAAGLREFGIGLAHRVDGIAVDAGRAADKANEIAPGVSDILKEAKRIEAGIGDMTGPWGCVSLSCLGTVRFPHDKPPEVRANAECGELRAEDIPIPTKGDLSNIVRELDRRKPSSIWILGHASTLGSESHNGDLSWRRARFVECRLKDTLGELLIYSKTCAAGEKASTDSLRYPDFRYRLVQVLSGQPPEYLSGLQCE